MWIYFLSFLAFATGTLSWKLIEFAYPIIKERQDRKRDAYTFVSQSIDPILKAADELYGKLVSLSDEDFSLFNNPPNVPITKEIERNQKYVCYLFAQFWAQMEHIRVQSRYSSICSIKKGEQLLKFINTCETRKFRILDRSVQRIIGEALIAGSNGAFRVMSLNDFMRKLENKKSDISKWIPLLQKELTGIYNKDVRQRILRYGIIVASLVNHFDPKHKITIRRKIYTLKLTPASKRIVGNYLFRKYLDFIDSPWIYFHTK